MTIIACKDGFMAADTASWVGGRRYGAAVPKITKAADGSLWALTGLSADAYHLRQWVIAGADYGNPPEFEGAGDDSWCALLMKPDGSVWSAKGAWRFSPHESPNCSGESNAANFCEGAMAAGLSAKAAVHLTIAHHIYAGGVVQVERAGNT